MIAGLLEPDRSEPLAVSSARCGHRLVVRFRGELDVGTVPFADAALTAATDGFDGSVVVVDLTDVAFFDSAAVHWLVAAIEDRRYRWEVQASAAVRRVLTLAGADHRVRLAG